MPTATATPPLNRHLATDEPADIRLAPPVGRPSRNAHIESTDFVLIAEGYRVLADEALDLAESNLAASTETLPPD